MSLKILFISEALSAPFDEGIKNVTLSLHKYLGVKRDVLSVTKTENDTDDLKVTKVGLNKLFLNEKLRRLIKSYSPDVILYLPEASATFNSFLRAKVLKLMNRLSKVVMLAVQHREYSTIQNFIISRYLKPDLLFLLGKSDKDFFWKKGFNIKVLPPAVDNIRFCPATREGKEEIRNEYKIPNSKKVILHVGHIKKDRNIECLLEVQKIEDIQVVVVGSTSIGTEHSLKDKFVEAGIIVVDKYIPDISKIYKMSDVYVFPVISNTDAIEMPLSVLEAMACNLPVITTRFGGLVNFFKEDEGFRYFDNTDELVELVKNIDAAKVSNTKKIVGFTWDRFTEEIMAACNELIADNS